MQAVDGRTGVAALQNGRAELLILDAFVGAGSRRGHHMEFFRDVRRVLADTGSS